MYKKAVLAGGCFWGEPVWETGARPFEVFLEATKRNIQKVYSSCKE